MIEEVTSIKLLRLEGRLRRLYSMILQSLRLGEYKQCGSPTLISSHRIRNILVENGAGTEYILATKQIASIKFV